MAEGARKNICILTPVFNEEGNLERYRQRVTETLMSGGRHDFRVLFIDDGSSDRSWEIIERIHQEDERFAGIRLSRNFGPHVAISAGFDHAADADAVVVLACDLQDPPEVVLSFVERWERGAQIVWGRRRSRSDSRWKIAASNLFSSLIQRFAMPRDSKFATGSFLLADRIVADCFRRFHEHNRITFALIAWTGFRQEVVEYDRARRVSGVSGWNFSKMLKAMYDTFIGFSFLPIRLITILGVGFFLFSFLFSVYVVMSWIFKATAMPGWTSLMLGLSFFFGIQFFLMGIVGEYLYRIYTESVRRPLYFVSDSTRSRAGPDA